MEKHKELLITLGVTFMTVFVCFLWLQGRYNTMIEQEEKVKTAWSQVENQYQRRSNLIPNLVTTVKAYAAHEIEVLERLVQARTKASSVTVNSEELTEQSLLQFQQAQGEVSNSLRQVLGTMENHPVLQSNESFKELQVQLEGSENRISVERMRFNEIARDHNIYLRRFPNSILSKVFGFKPKAYFTTEDNTDQVPLIEF